MKILFWTVVSLLITLAPFVFRVDGNFCLRKKTAFVCVRFFRSRVFSLLLFFAPDGVYYSIYGKKGKPIGEKKKSKSKKKKISVPFSVESLKFTDISVKCYIGGETDSVNCTCGALLAFIGSAMDTLEKRGLLDRGNLLVLPSYVSNQTTVNFSICVFTSIAKILSSFVHTKSGEKYAKRRDWEHNG